MATVSWKEMSFLKLLHLQSQLGFKWNWSGFDSNFFLKCKHLHTAVCHRHGIICCGIAGDLAVIGTGGRGKNVARVHKVRAGGVSSTVGPVNDPGKHLPRVIVMSLDIKSIQLKEVTSLGYGGCVYLLFPAVVCYIIVIKMICVCLDFVLPSFSADISESLYWEFGAWGMWQQCNRWSCKSSFFLPRLVSLSLSCFASLKYKHSVLGGGYGWSGWNEQPCCVWMNTSVSLLFLSSAIPLLFRHTPALFHFETPLLFLGVFSPPYPPSFISLFLSLAIIQSGAPPLPTLPCFPF